MCDTSGGAHGLTGAAWSLVGGQRRPHLVRRDPDARRRCAQARIETYWPNSEDDSERPPLTAICPDCAPFRAGGTPFVTSLAEALQRAYGDAGALLLAMPHGQE